MAHIVRVTPITDGPKKAIFHVYLESDGVESELTNRVLVDSKIDFPNSSESATNIVKMSILQVWYSFSWFDGLLKFDDIDPYNSWLLARDAHGYHDLRYFGGLKDRSTIDGRGKLMLTTNGFKDFGNVGTMVIELKKD